MSDQLPHLGAHHPAGLAFAALNQATQIVIGQLDQLAAGATMHAADVIRVRELLEEGTNQIAAFYFLFIRTERALEELRVESVRINQAMHRVEQRNTHLADQHNRARATANALVEQLRALPLTPDSFAPKGVLSLEKSS